MPKDEERKVPREQCSLCAGKGWFRTHSGWPTECHRCRPEVKTAKGIPDAPTLPVKQPQGDGNA